MDSRTFDRLVADAARTPTRRSALRLLAGAFVAAAAGAPRFARAQEVDSDADGLFDDDETAVYGTNPGAADTDGDGSSDGEEVYFGTNPLAADAAAARADTDGDGLFDDDETAVYGTNPGAADTDSDGVSDGQEVFNGTDPLVNPNQAPPPPAAPVCFAPGTPCDADGQCCAGSLCCFDGVSLRTECTDVAATGGVCPGDPVGPVTCAAGLTNCNGSCVDLTIATFDCGSCGNSCGLGGACTNGVCGAAPAPAPACPGGTCNGLCVDLNSDSNNCGVCGLVCGAPTRCYQGFCQGAAVCSPGKTNCDGVCADLLNDPFHCGACYITCYSKDPDLFGPIGTCSNALCNA